MGGEVLHTAEHFPSLAGRYHPIFVLYVTIGGDPGGGVPMECFWVDRPPGILNFYIVCF